MSRSLCAASLATIIGASALHAQQGCRAVTAAALGSVTHFLNLPTDVAWLAAHGITATDASTLTPLTMASNAATCVRIDSSFTSSPITAFRAGAYVIATESPVAPDPITGRIRMRETGHVLVFDTLGTFVYLPGTGVGPAIPLSLRVTVATPGNVQLMWTNQFTSAVSYQLQRATGSGSFSDLGAALSPSDTSATDVSAAAATTYRYRVAAIGPDGGRSFTLDVTVAIADPGTVTRPTVVGCAPGPRTSTPIPFEQVDLGAAGVPQSGDDLLLGSRMMVVVTDSTRWPAIWRAAADTIPVPPVAFGKSVLVLVATRTHGMGRVRLRVTSIRQCRDSGDIIVSTMQTGPGGAGISILSRGFDVVRVRGRELAMKSVLFEDHFRSKP